jgi:hypothetical protein
MNIVQIEENVQKSLNTFSRELFIYDFLLAYDTPKSIIKRLKEGALNLSKNEGEILWKKKLFFKEINEADLHLAIDELKAEPKISTHLPRFIIVTDYETLLAIDTKTQDSLDVPFLDLAKHFDFFLPLAGMEKAQLKFENPADVKAAEKMAKLYDEINKDNPTNTVEEVHSLNVFLSRLLFCFFAEDTEIFTKNLFTNSIKSHTQGDGSDLSTYFQRLFEVLNTDYPHRVDLPQYLSAFPYVNGGLFRDSHPIPHFKYKSRQAIIECGELNWKDINPDIFGSMIQAVITTEHRGSMGMHYTSVPNIMKVIEPLFLNELYEEFENSKNQPQKLNSLLYRLSRIKIFDPACGSGNFLIIAYKELRLLEIKIIQRLEYLQQATSGFEEKQLALIPKAQQSLAAMFQKRLFSNIQLNQFFGIELDDFAHEIGTLSPWLAQHQMNVKFKEVLGQGNPTLPLRESGNIEHGNATRVNWDMVCPKREGDEIYILGNPPYLGSSMQSAGQKADLALVCKGFENYKNLDYIACWFVKGAHYISNFNAKYSFVSTNSICQGEQVALMWPSIFNKDLEIGFANTSFKWTNNAKANAAVIVSIIGVRNISNKPKYLHHLGLSKTVGNINPYLIQGKNIVLPRRASAISAIPQMLYGNKPTDGGHLILEVADKDSLIRQFPMSKKFIRKFASGGDFLNNIERWCLWIEDCDVTAAENIPPIKARLDAVKAFRLESDAMSTVEYAVFPNRFRQITFRETPSIIVPLTSSERRSYIPFGFISGDTVVSNSASVIYDADPWVFGLISSRMHMAWVRTVAGRLKSDYRYSSALCYNNFPFPKISKHQVQELEKHVFRILDDREKFSEKTLSELYDPNKMPQELREAHDQLDLAVERCYRSKPFESDEERLEYLFKLYEQMITEEKTQGTLFETTKKLKKFKTPKNA